VTYTRCCIDTIDSPDDEHKVARNMCRIDINIYKRDCASGWLFIRVIPNAQSVYAVSGTSRCLFSDKNKTWL